MSWTSTHHYLGVENFELQIYNTACTHLSTPMPIDRHCHNLLTTNADPILHNSELGCVL